MSTEREWRSLYDRGWSLVPCKADKRPYVDWTIYQHQRASWETIKGWLAEYHDPNPAVITGRISGIIVMDQDGLQGAQSILGAGVVPSTPKVQTGRGPGHAHYYFAYPTIPEGARVKSRAGVLPGLDSKADGGYVIAAGAMHQSGNKYQWEASPEEWAFAQAPQWWLDLVVTDEADPANTAENIPLVFPTQNSWNGSNRELGYVRAALRYEAEKVANAPDGSKHDRLLSSAIAIGGFTWVIPEQEIEAVLYEAIAPRAQDRRAARITIRDGIEMGSHRPREIPAPRLTLVKSEVHTNGKTPDAESEDKSDPLITAHLSDNGNAECMEYLRGEDFRFDHTRRKWLVWQGARWGVDSDGEAERAAVATIKARQVAALDIVDGDKRKRAMAYLLGAENQSKQKGLLAQASILRSFATTIALFDTGHWKTGAPNGVLALDTGKLHEASREDLITMCLGTVVDAGAKCPRWVRFLSEVFAGDEELIAFVQRAVGYSLTGDTSEQKMFLCHGAGANGKSVFLETLSLMLGDYAGGTPFATFDADKRNESTNDLAALKGRRFVTVIESDEDRRLAEARVKAVTGQDTITCRFLYGEFFTYRPTFKLWMAMNHKPIIRGTDRGIWRRIVLIPFTQNFEGREDKNLTDDLREELPGILNWATQGLTQWRKHGLGTARVITAATEEYRKESDILGQWFTDSAASSPGAFTLASTAYDSFRGWCHAFGYKEPTQTGFARGLIDRGYDRATHHNKRGYVGFILTGGLADDEN